MTEIIKVEPSSYGIEERQANELIGHLPQLKAERELLEQQYHEVIQMDIESPETAKIAKDLRIKIRDNRTKGIEVWHRTKKDYFLKGGQFVDAIKRMETEVNKRMESSLEEIEKYAEIQEAKRAEALKAERMAVLEPYMEFVPVDSNLLGLMRDDEFQKLLNGAKLQHEAKLEAERKAEEERIEAEKKAETERLERERLDKLELARLRIAAPLADFIEEDQDYRNMTDIQFDELINIATKSKEYYDAEQSKIRAENERLRKEAEERERLAKIERDKQAKIEAERIAKEQAEKEAQAEKERIEREAYEAKLKAGREEKERIERELQAKKDAEAKAERERVAAEKRAAAAPDKEKLNALANRFASVEMPVLATEEAGHILGQIKELQSRLVKYITDKATTL